MRAPWLLVAALFLLWAHGIYDGRFGDSSGYVPGDIQDRTLRFLGRTLQFEEIAEVQPALIQDTLYGADLDEMLEETVDALSPYEEKGELESEGKRALAVAREVSGEPRKNLSALDGTTRAILQEEPLEKEAVEALAQKIRGPIGSWWDEKLGRWLVEYQSEPAVADALAWRNRKTIILFNLNLVCSGLWWILVIGGLVFLPHAIRTVRSSWASSSPHRPVRYPSRWEPSLVVALLLAADLLAGYLLTEAYTVTADLDTGFIFDVVVDSAWRIIAPAIALFIFFRRPSHAIRALGMDKMPDWRLIVAVFSLISWLNIGFGTLTEPWSSFDPSGGLDPMESGWGGLFYGLLSACIFAPVAEEIFYRGILQRGLERRFGFWISSSVATLAFMLAHSYDLLGLVTVGILGFTMVVVYRTTRVLTNVILIHALYNFMITLPDWITYHSP